MKMGIKEFRERLGEVATGDQVIVLTHHGRRVGRYVPDRLRAPHDLDVTAWAKEQEETSRRWRSVTPDWRDRLRLLGFSHDEIAELEAEDACC